MNPIEALKDIYSVVSGSSDLIRIAASDLPANSARRAAEYAQAVSDIAGGIGTVAQGVGNFVGQYVSVVSDVYGAEPRSWATGSITGMNLLGKHFV
ncbi:hypothetical protein ACTJK5_10625 [Agrobacterium sp. 22094]|uniref:hypothetical protein n=1 Tax=Agrobacterium sp. 22094 TaxID=3453872 RepID=UPI003F8517E6